MPNYYISKGTFDSTSVNKYKYILDWIEATLDDTYHIFLDFRVPYREKRDVDILILKTNGIWLFEEKSLNYTKIEINGPWEYQDRRGNIKKTQKIIKSGYENPYKQAESTANNFSDWLEEHEKKIGKKSRRKKKIYPCVIFPLFKNKKPFIENHSWCYISHGTKGAEKNIRNRDWGTDYLTEQEIEDIAQELSLEKISHSDLLTYKINIESIFKKTGINQLEKLKKSLFETNQVDTSGKWLFKLKCIPQETTPDKDKTDLLNNFPFLLKGEGGAGKTIIGYQLLEELISKRIGFFIPLRDITYSQEKNKVFFENNDLSCALNINQMKDSDILNIIIFIINTIIFNYSKIENVDTIRFDKAIKYYLKNQNIVLILDGWDEITPQFRKIGERIIDVLFTEDILFSIACRTPVDGMLSEKFVRNKKAVYVPAYPDKRQMELYLKYRLKQWNIEEYTKQIIALLCDTFNNNVLPFYLFLSSFLPIKEQPHNMVELLRRFVYATVLWQIYNREELHEKEAASWDSLLNLLKNRTIEVAGKTLPVNMVIDTSIETGNTIFPDGSLFALLGKISLEDMGGNNQTIDYNSIVKINPLVKDFVEERIDQEANYSYPSIRIVLIRDYFIAESTYIAFRQNYDKKFPLYSLGIAQSFKEILELDKRWKIGCKKTINQIIVKSLLDYPIDLYPTIVIPTDNYEGDNIINVSKIASIIPDWYTKLLESCTIKITNMLCNDIEDDKIYAAYFSIRKRVPEIAGYQGWDLEIKDTSEIEIAMSLPPIMFTGFIFDLFPEYKKIMSREYHNFLIAYYRDKKNEAIKNEEKTVKVHEELKCPVCDKGKNNGFLKYDTHNLKDKKNKNFEMDIKEKVEYEDFLYNLVKQEEYPGLRSWAEYVFKVPIGMVPILIKENFSFKNIIKSIPFSSMGDWIRYDEDSGCTDHVFLPNMLAVIHDIIITILANYNDELSELLIKAFETLITYTPGINITLYLKLILNKIPTVVFREILESIVQSKIGDGGYDYYQNCPNYFVDVISNNQAVLLSFYINSLENKHLVLKYKQFLILFNFNISISQNDYYWLLDENEKKRKKLESEDEGTSYYKNEIKETHKERVEIYKCGLSQGFPVDCKVMGKASKSIEDIKWIVNIGKINNLNIDQEYKNAIFATISPALRTVKALHYNEDENLFNICFYRFISGNNYGNELPDYKIKNEAIKTWVSQDKMKDEGDYSLKNEWDVIQNAIIKYLPAKLKNKRFAKFLRYILKNKLYNLDRMCRLFLDANTNNKYYPSYHTTEKERDRISWQRLKSILDNLAIKQIVEASFQVNKNCLEIFLKLYPYLNEPHFDTVLFNAATKLEVTFVRDTSKNDIFTPILNYGYFGLLQKLTPFLSLSSFGASIRILKGNIYKEEFSIKEKNSLLDCTISKLETYISSEGNNEKLEDILTDLYKIAENYLSYHIERILQITISTNIFPYGFFDFLGVLEKVIEKRKKTLLPLLKDAKKHLFVIMQDQDSWKKGKSESSIKKIDFLLALGGDNNYIKQFILSITQFLHESIESIGKILDQCSLEEVKKLTKNIIQKTQKLYEDDLKDIKAKGKWASSSWYDKDNYKKLLIYLYKRNLGKLPFVLVGFIFSGSCMEIENKIEYLNLILKNNHNYLDSASYKNEIIELSLPEKDENVAEFCNFLTNWNLTSTAIDYLENQVLKEDKKELEEYTSCNDKYLIDLGILKKNNIEYFKGLCNKIQNLNLKIQICAYLYKNKMGADFIKEQIAAIKSYFLSSGHSELCEGYYRTVNNLEHCNHWDKEIKSLVQDKTKYYYKAEFNTKRELSIEEYFAGLTSFEVTELYYMLLFGDYCTLQDEKPIIRKLNEVLPDDYNDDITLEKYIKYIRDNYDIKSMLGESEVTGHFDSLQIELISVL